MNITTRHAVRRTAAPALLGLLVLATAACGSAADADDDVPDAPADAACLVGTDDCDDTAPPADGGDPDAIDEGAAIRAAEGLLGVAETELAADVRVARRGDEQFALTEDYVIGRVTVELDDTDGSGFRVVSATVELTEGPQTVS